MCTGRQGVTKPGLDCELRTMSDNVVSYIEKLLNMIPKLHWGETAVRVPPSQVDLEVGGGREGRRGRDERCLKNS